MSHASEPVISDIEADVDAGGLSLLTLIIIVAIVIAVGVYSTYSQ